MNYVIKLVKPMTPTTFSFFPRKNNYSNSFHSSTAIAALLQRFIDSTSPSPGQAVHSHILKSGLRGNTNVSIKLLILHLKCGSLSYARQVLDQMPSPTLSAFNFMIAGYFKGGHTDEILELVRKLGLSNERPDGFTLSMVLKLSATLASVDLAKQVHPLIIKLACELDDVLVAALVDSYVKNGKLRYARRVFNAMPEENVVCSTALIHGYMNQMSFGEAEEIFQNIVDKDVVVFNAMIEGYSKTVETAIQSLEFYKDMQCWSFQPTISTFVSVIGACSLLSALEFGQQLHSQVIKTGIFLHVKSGSAFIDMYAKCGRTDDAWRVFHYMPEKNVFSWTSMIDGYGKNGNSHEALALFYEMRKCAVVKPNLATFLSALSACGHAGLVLEGQEIFNSMERDYSLKPRMEHYACMVYLLGRMGYLQEAYNFIKKIPDKPNSDVWAALLASSRLHGHLKLADIAANEVFKLSRYGRPGAYLALSNTLAAAGKWEDVSDVRELMRERGVSKDAGCSWVGTDKGLSDFHVAQRE
ncbi:hypothetical protein J5N97_027173 [Dioscorea zingiberensis]|uniref:Pentatricopeptide repeat-containing protein-mitochondrial domain-containing protein n=1 Tax=Dioscorea zingiberensis TaxID=325984 RepID=A0A9D5C3Q5_9LILI|nr:hypothetical protein J5N97_027173 [Dioscorea zingiberensis]